MAPDPEKRCPLNRATLAITVFALTTSAGSAGAAMIGSAGTGYSAPGYTSDATAELRNLKNSGDFEIGFKQAGAGSYVDTAQAAWIKGVNDLVISYNTVTNAVSVSLNGATSSTTLGADPASLTFHLTAQNAGSHTASLTVQDLALNGSAIDLNGLGTYLFASSKAGSGAVSSITNARIDDETLLASSWTITGQILTDWTGPAPANSRARVDISFASPVAIPASADVPASGGIALGALALGFGVSRRTRRATT